MSRLPLVSRAFVLALVPAFAFTACGKSVTKKGSSFSQTEPPAGIEPPLPMPSGSPVPMPSTSPNPTLTPSPKPSVSPTPSPRPSPTVVPAPSPTVSPRPSTTPVPTPSPSPSATPVACDPSGVAPLLSYSVYAKDDVRLSCTKLRMRVAGSDACATTAEIARELVPNAARADLTVSHDLTLSGVKVPNGKAVYGRSLESKKSSALGGFAKVSGVDLSAEWKKVLAFSSACAAAPANAKVERVCTSPSLPNGPAGEFALAREVEDEDGSGDGREDEIETTSSPSPSCTLRITGTDPKLNLANLSLAQLSNVRTITVDIPSESVFVGTFAKLKSTTFAGVQVRLVRSFSADRIFWNLPVAEKLAFNSTKFVGTVVSPKADVGVCKNDGIGAFWAESLQASDSSW